MLGRAMFFARRRVRERPAFSETFHLIKAGTLVALAQGQKDFSVRFCASSDADRPLRLKR